MIQIKNLSFSYPSSREVLFSNINLIFYPGFNGIAGNNGSGKSTLLSLISGDLLPDNGTIITDGDVVYCAQVLKEFDDEIYSYFWSPDPWVGKIFSLLRVDDSFFDRFETLSGGEKKRMQLALALAKEPSVLLLDEPTNHLDRETKELIISALKEFQGTCLIVTHDREFSERIISKTYFVEKISDKPVIIKDYPFPLEKTLQEREDRNKSILREIDLKNQNISSIKKSVSQANEKVLAGKAKLSKKGIAKNDHDAKGKIDAARLTGKDRGAGDEKRRLETKLSKEVLSRDSLDAMGKRKEGITIKTLEGNSNVISLENGEIIGGEYSLIYPEIMVQIGDKIAITGNNGTGKTLFIKKLIEEYERKTGRNDYLYLSQNMENEEEIIAMYNELDDKEKGSIISTIYRLGSEPTSFLDGDKEVSPGELRKLSFAIGLSGQVRLLILDEPTNHLDIGSLLSLETALESVANVAIVFVSHDEKFREKIKTKEYVLTRENNKGVMRENLS